MARYDAWIPELAVWTSTWNRVLQGASYGASPSNDCMVQSPHMSHCQSACCPICTFVALWPTNLAAMPEADMQYFIQIAVPVSLNSNTSAVTSRKGADEMWREAMRGLSEVYEGGRSLNDYFDTRLIISTLTSTPNISKRTLLSTPLSKAIGLRGKRPCSTDSYLFSPPVL
jgi:hypothetical protein